MRSIIRSMDNLSAQQIIYWEYEYPYSLYNLHDTQENKNELLNGSYYSLYDDDLIGYFCFGKSAQVPGGNKIDAYSDNRFMDIGLGMKPEICGKGFGYNFVRCGLEFASETFSINKFRLTVAVFNKRAVSVYERIGFRNNNVNFSNNNRGKQIEFMVMVLEKTISVNVS